MKNLFVLLIILVGFTSCKKEEVTQKSTVPSLIGDWGWDKTTILQYDQNGTVISSTDIEYDANTNIHNFSSDGNVYAGASIVGTHNGSSEVTITIGSSVMFTITDLTTTSMVLRQHPSGCTNCGSEDRYYIK